ncbi:tetratricopeptide repeat protein [Metabacillus bambusae]|uniref:Tetratricopeptide repeat protein n=1 Tax=Metabacillus bambusae TaxID=2795218 RepID=A0ABS3N7W7_9BACI|nr:tetratricopeptide repeat protein [Metabacillus bambusae]MBO1514354.1 tetratricopeptide repeat protein [Metabacillus bambusae]
MIESSKSTLGVDNDFTAVCLYEMAKLKYENKQMKEAMDLFLEAYKTRKARIGSDNPVNKEMEIYI